MNLELILRVTQTTNQDRPAERPLALPGPFTGSILLRPGYFENKVVAFSSQFDWLLQSRDPNAMTFFKQSGNFLTSFYAYFASNNLSQYVLPI